MFGDNTLGSDESLGGALLTPIPWLNNSMSSEEDHEGFAEPDASPTVQEEHTHTHPDQESEASHAHGTTTNHHPQQQQTTAAGSRGQSPDSEDGDSVPHPRGPALLGVEDLGLQNGRGVEMTLETAATNSTPHAADTGGETQGQQVSSELDADADGDVVIADVPEAGETQGRAETKENEAEVSQSEAA